MSRRWLLPALCVVCSSAAFLAAASAGQEPAPQPPARTTIVARAEVVVEPQAAGSKVWIGRYEEFERFLAETPIEKTADIPVGVTKPKRAFFTPGGIGGSAALKYLPAGIKSGFWESYKSEIAAYKLDRILGMDMVPPTIERRVGPELASLQLWIDDCRLLDELDQSACPRPNNWAKQVCRQRAFDNLIANVDRNRGNLIVDGEWNLVLIDHSRAFGSNTMPFMKQMNRIDREFYAKLKALDEPTLMRELRPWVLGGGSVKDVLKRRDKIVAHFEKLAREKGEAAVFPF